MTDPRIVREQIGHIKAASEAVLGALTRLAYVQNVSARIQSLDDLQLALFKLNKATNEAARALSIDIKSGITPLIEGETLD